MPAARTSTAARSCGWVAPAANAPSSRSMAAVASSTVVFAAEGLRPVRSPRSTVRESPFHPHQFGEERAAVTMPSTLHES